MAWSKLLKNFEPQTATSYIKLQREFSNSKLEEGEDPDAWITKLEGLKTDMNLVEIQGKSAMSEIDLIVHILASLPESYEVPVSFLEDKLTDTSGGPILTIEQVRAKILERHDRKEDHDKQNEVAFAAITMPAEAGSDRRIKICNQSSNQPVDAKPDVRERFF